MGTDPLSVFLNEKIAADLASSTAATLPPVRETSATSMDPGERAIAAIAIAPLAQHLTQWLGRMGLEHLGERGSEPWVPQAPQRGLAHLSGSDPSWTMASAPKKPSKLLGLFDVAPRVKPFQTQDEARRFVAAAGKIQEVQGIVDSFIDHHGLAEKGVRVNLHGGLLGSNTYNPFTKEVTLKNVGKELALHELGHAADFTGSRIGKLRARFGPMLERGVMAAVPIALVAGDRIKEMLPGTIDDKAISFMQDHAPSIVGATLAATQLYPEAKASVLALQHIARTEGPAAARKAFGRLGAGWATYALGAIPPIVGLALARKYMRQARDEREQADQAKVASAMESIRRRVGGVAQDIAHIGKQIGTQTAELVREPGTARRIANAARAVGTAPEFAHGALTAGVPTALTALYLYGTDSGRLVRDRLHPSDRNKFLSGRHGFDLIDSSGSAPTRLPGAARISESWREQNPLRFAGLAGLGAALAGGVITKTLMDLRRVL